MLRGTSFSQTPAKGKEIQIRYAVSEDGTRLADAVLGEGDVPLLILPSLFSHLQLQWNIQSLQQWYERVAAHRKIVLYDGRGSGLSDRNVTDLSVEAQVSDIEAVARAEGLTRFALLGQLYSGPAAILYAARNPERVTHLILWHALWKTSDHFLSDRTTALNAIAGQNWGLFTETMYARLGWSEGLLARQMSEKAREALTPEMFLKSVRALSNYNMSEYLPHISQDTLVIHSRAYSAMGLEASQYLASTIPHARLVILPTVMPHPHMLALIDGMHETPELIDAFLSEDIRRTASPSPAGEPALSILSEREREVAGLVAKGLHNREIANQLTISVHTVERHLSNIFGRTGVRSRAELASYAVRNKLA